MTSPEHFEQLGILSSEDILSIQEPEHLETLRRHLAHVAKAALERIDEISTVLHEEGHETKQRKTRMPAVIGRYALEAGGES